MVTTPVSTLTAGGSGKTNVFQDLGDGPVFGLQPVGAANNGGFVTIALNSTFLAAVNLAPGGTIALGGFFTSLDANPATREFAFAYTDSGTPGDGNTRLVLNGPVTNVPEPSSWAMALGGLGVLVLLQRRRTRLA